MREALQPIAIGHQHADRFALALRKRDRQRGADGGRHLRRRLLCQHRRQRKAGAFAHRRDVEAQHRRRQQTDIGERRIAPADAGIVIEHRHAIFAEQIAQAIRLAGLGRLADPQEDIRNARLQSLALDRRQGRDGLHQRFRGAAGFGDRDKARGRVRQPGKQRSEAVGVEIVDEMQLRRRAQCADARHGEARKLRQGLPAEAGAAGAEDNDVGCPVRELARGIPDRLQIAVRFRQAQQRQTAVGMAGAQPIKRAFCPRQSGFQRISTDPCGPTCSSRALSIDWTMLMPVFA